MSKTRGEALSQVQLPRHHHCCHQPSQQVNAPVIITTSLNGSQYHTLESVFTTACLRVKNELEWRNRWAQRGKSSASGDEGCLLRMSESEVLGREHRVFTCGRLSQVRFWICDRCSNEQEAENESFIAAALVATDKPRGSRGLAKAAPLQILSPQSTQVTCRKVSHQEAQASIDEPYETTRC